MQKTQAFQIGRDLGAFGRWFRLIVGGYFTVLLTIVPLVQDPVPAGEALAFLGRLGLYFILIAAAYLAGFYLLGERLLARANPWIGTLIFLGPLVPISGFRLGPPEFRVAFGVYINVSLVLNFIISYGGCEVLAIPTLLFRRRYTVYCPYNAVDAVESALSVAAQGQRSFGIVSIAVALLVGGYYILLDWMDLADVLPWNSDPRWALLFLIPSAFLVRTGWVLYQTPASQRRLPASNLIAGAFALLVITAIFYFQLDWESVWGPVMVVGGAYAIVQLFRQ